MTTLIYRENASILLYSIASSAGEVDVSGNNNRKVFWSRLRIAAAAMAALGIVGSIWNDSIPWPWLQYLIREFSVALFVAGLLAVTADALFKTALARDVFNAAFSYVLPDELKQEVRRIIEYKFLWVKHEMVLKLVPGEGSLFKLEISVQRTIRNISRHKQKINNSFALDDWGFGLKPEIKRCTMRYGAKTFESSKEREDLTSEAVGRETEGIDIKYKEEVVLVSEGFEIKPANSEFLINFQAPTVNPTVDIEMPAGFKHSFGFGVPGEEVIKSSIRERYELNGTHFPGQSMRLRWWKGADGG